MPDSGPDSARLQTFRTARATPVRGGIFFGSRDGEALALEPQRKRRAAPNPAAQHP